ncbi:MAG TPA: TetR/AcrR family transcriptional regulator [Capsulimonadaceae bacterium]|jgi:AcrR family transcriptional regulator
MPQRYGSNRTRESRAEHTKKLIDAAYALVPEVGISGLRTRDIAERAGVHLATFHYCFESKDALLAALYEDIVSSFTRAIQEYIIPKDDAADRLDGHRKMRHYLLVENRQLLIVWKAFTGAMWTEPAIADIVRPHYRIMRERLVPYIESGRKDGLFANLPTDNPTAAAAIILGLYDSGLTQMWLDPEYLPLADFEEGLRILYGA